MPTAKSFVGLEFEQALAAVRGGPTASAFYALPTPQELNAIYSRGFQGVRPWKTTFEQKKKFGEMRASMPKLYDAFPWAKGMGKGKISCPYTAIWYFFKDWGGCDAQQRGDCFLAGTMVRMADGSERPIEQVEVGEYVLSHRGIPQLVTKTVCKPYSGQLVTIRASGYHQELTATANHKFAVYENLWNKSIPKYRDRLKNSSEELSWTRIDSLNKGDLVLIPRPNIDEQEWRLPIAKGKSIKLDERLAYLLGVYAAEGGVYGRRITFHLGTHETVLIEQVKQTMSDLFGIECTVRKKKNCPSVTLVRGSNLEIAQFFSRMIPGNQWTKSIPWQVLSASRSVKLAMIRGWMDGDGHASFGKRSSNSKHYACRVMGVSVSNKLCKSMFNLANSCGLRASFYKRDEFDPEKRTQAKELYLYGDSALAVYPERKSECKVKIERKNRYITEFGIATEIKDIKTKQYTGNVYCIEVANDHSFIAEGYAVHNCTVHGTRNSCSIDYGCDALMGETKYQGPLANENIYRSRGFNGDGWSCEAPCSYVGPDGKGGLLHRQVYSNGSQSVDLSHYNPSWEGNGNAGVPTWLEEESRKNKVKWVIPIQTAEEYRDALALGFGINVCSGQGFSSTTDSSGVANAQGSWSHSMAHTACIDTDWAHSKYGDQIGGIQQSWGDWNKINGKPDGTPDMPTGMFYSRFRTILNMIGDDSFAMCGVWGWERSNWEAFSVTELRDALKNSTVQDYYYERANKVYELSQRAIEERMLQAL